MGPRCSSAETQVCHRSYIIAARIDSVCVLYVSVLFVFVGACDKTEVQIKNEPQTLEVSKIREKNKKNFEK
jgi:hypothetical protein